MDAIEPVLSILLTLLLMYLLWWLKTKYNLPRLIPQRWGKWRNYAGPAIGLLLIIYLIFIR